MSHKLKRLASIIPGSGILLILAFPVYWISSEIYWGRHVVPPETFRYSKYTNYFGEPYKEFSRDLDDGSYKIVYGQMPSIYLFALASGPPAYVFDQEGNMVDWSGDIGDDNRFLEKWIGK